jgi:hypothetical protein
LPEHVLDGNLNRLDWLGGRRGLVGVIRLAMVRLGGNGNAKGFRESGSNLLADIHDSSSSYRIP